MNLASVVGQPRACAALGAVLRSGRVPGAFLFHGRAGVGKFRTAVAFARALLCAGDPDDGAERRDDACETCRACRRSGQRLHPNLRIVAEGSDVRSVKIDTVRDLQAELALKPMEGRRKVVVLDNADRLLPAAANALLKTLEEPPPDTTLILVAASLDRVLETIRSRCHHLRFRPLSPEDARAVLERVEQREETPSIDPDRRAFLARFAGGSPGRALDLGALGFVTEGDALVEILLALGGPRGDPLDAAASLEALAVGSAKVDRARRRVLVEEALQFLAAFVADVLRDLAGDDPERGVFAPALRAGAGPAPPRSPDRWEIVLRWLLETAHNVRLNADVDLAVGNLFLAIDQRFGGGTVASSGAATAR